MSYRCVLTVQDISCVGQCSMTVALPVLSACGCETCVLPSAVLSSHTGGFTNPTFRDLSEDIPGIVDHWTREDIFFDAIYTGYLGSIQQIDYVSQLMKSRKAEGGVTIVDPAMADHGRLYKGFDERYASAVKELCAQADVILPNLTEACMMAGISPMLEYREEDIISLLKALAPDHSKIVLLTGVSYESGKTGVAVLDRGEYWYYAHDKVEKSYHGTGDLFAAAFTGSWMRTGDLKRAVQIASDFTVRSIRNTFEDPAHWYGVKFEPALKDLILQLNG